MIYLILLFMTAVIFFVLVACVPTVGKIRVLTARLLAFRGHRVNGDVGFVSRFSLRMNQSLKPFGVKVASICVVNFRSVLGILEFSFTGTVDLLGGF